MSQCTLLLPWNAFGRCVAVDGCGILVFLGTVLPGWRCCCVPELVICLVWWCMLLALMGWLCWGSVRVGVRFVVNLGCRCSPNRKWGSFLSTNHNEYRGLIRWNHYAPWNDTEPRAPAWSKTTSLGGVLVPEVSSIGEKRTKSRTMLTSLAAKKPPR